MNTLISPSIRPTAAATTALTKLPLTATYILPPNIILLFTYLGVCLRFQIVVVTGFGIHIYMHMSAVFVPVLLKIAL